MVGQWGQGPGGVRQAKAMAELQERYMVDAVATASPAARLVMLYDKLVADCTMADAAFERRDWYQVNEALVNAQEILIYLSASLEPELWPEAGDQLRALYNFLYSELVEVNLRKDRERLGRPRGMISQLADAWRQAAGNLATQEAPAAGQGHAEPGHADPVHMGPAEASTPHSGVLAGAGGRDGG